MTGWDYKRGKDAKTIYRKNIECNKRSNSIALENGENLHQVRECRKGVQKRSQNQLMSLKTQWFCSSQVNQKEGFVDRNPQDVIFLFFVEGVTHEFGDAVYSVDWKPSGFLPRKN